MMIRSIQRILVFTFALSAISTYLLTDDPGIGAQDRVLVCGGATLLLIAVIFARGLEKRNFFERETERSNRKILSVSVLTLTLIGGILLIAATIMGLLEGFSVTTVILLGGTLVFCLRLCAGSMDEKRCRVRRQPLWSR